MYMCRAGQGAGQGGAGTQGRAGGSRAGGRRAGDVVRPAAHSW